MERYYLELTTSGKLPAGATLNVTGFSLGGHLATVFTELHTNQVAQTTVFNASGRGRMDGFSGTDAATLSAEAQQIDANRIHKLSLAVRTKHEHTSENSYCLD